MLLFPLPLLVFKRQANTATRNQEARRLFVVVSEDCLERAGGLVEALRTSSRRPYVGSLPTRLEMTAADAPVRVSLVELPVEAPIDLVVGGRCGQARGEGLTSGV